METITVSRLERLGCFDAKPGQVVIFDNVPADSGVSVPAGLGETEEEARADAQRAAEEARIPFAVLNGPAFRIVADGDA